jgi:Trypsin
MTLVACASDVVDRADGVKAKQSYIVNGELSRERDWPAVVQVDSRCTGFMLTNRLVVYAAHCGQDIERIRLLEPERALEVKQCRVFPNGAAFENHSDIAYCTLEEPLDVPIVPAILPCELSQVAPQQEVVVVAYGETGAGADYGKKRQFTGRVADATAAELEVTGKAATTCWGDSGGPILTKLPSGEWRVLGLVSSADSGDCVGGMVTYATPIARFLTWLETNSRLDASPCTVDGEMWRASPACGWEAVDDMDCTACASEFSPGAASRCGDAREPSARDTEAPEVLLDITRAPQRAASRGETDAIPVVVRVTVADVPPVRRISYRIRGSTGRLISEVQELEPFELSVELDEGTWTVEVAAETFEGRRVVVSDSIELMTQPPKEGASCAASRPPAKSRSGGPLAEILVVLLAAMQRRHARRFRAR